MDIDNTRFSTIKVARPSWSKLKERLHFCLWKLKTNLHLKIWHILFASFGRNAYDADSEECFDDIEVDGPFAKDLDKYVKEYLAASPHIDPRRAVLFLAKSNEHGCNFITTRRFEKYISNLYRQARSWGMTTFIVDNSTPFGLLAHEILLAVKGQGEDFSLYVFQSKTFSKCKSFRLIPETDTERIRLNLSADYHYEFFSKDGIIGHFLNCAGLIITEKELLASPAHIPDYLFEAWGVSWQLESHSL